MPRAALRRGPNDAGNPQRNAGWPRMLEETAQAADSSRFICSMSFSYVQPAARRAAQLQRARTRASTRPTRALSHPPVPHLLVPLHSTHIAICPSSCPSRHRAEKPLRACRPALHIEHAARHLDRVWRRVEHARHAASPEGDGAYVEIWSALAKSSSSSVPLPMEGRGTHLEAEDEGAHNVRARDVVHPVNSCASAGCAGGPGRSA
ncbi:hypothetical protein HYPSUDRAFT_198904 [Hypholoma sublateritium FD-334 SS-4]|uniref:Uncharacterized protein n=1 Tax=Hypholoma sublateritium (strain FD-334 SS-4) TaxID=945553 RepID=A0A0D2Q520_HYPSF|nr:hypothetical protein HYPSUDRAFT_198904 [Hypholoma sublateritium FD-334 SS-4]